MNKAELIEALASRLGDKKSATSALDAVLTEIQTAVTKGDKVSITGFGVFEKRVRAARTARNPRTGETVKVKKTSVPAFRAGASFKEQVAAGKVAKAAVKKTTTAAAKKTATAAPAKRVAAKTATTATRTAAKTVAKTAAKKAPAKATRAAAAPVRKTTTAAATPAARTTARKAPASKTR